MAQNAIIAPKTRKKKGFCAGRKRQVNTMQRVYLDNGSTSYPKAPGVSDAVKFFMDEVGANVNRGGYESAYSAEDVIMETREMLRDLFHFTKGKTKNVIFTPNITYSLNYVIKGWLKAGDHVLVSSMEHNAMMRPIVQMGELGVTFDRIPCNENGEMQVEAIEGLIRPETKGILCLHGSNVCGAVMPLEEIGQICVKHGIKFVVDAAQTAGVFPIDMEKMNIDILCFTGHKSLLGPQGIGGFLISDEMAKVVAPLVTGGTGSVSDSEIQPEFLPDKYESGTPNIPAIYGLHAALKYLKETGIENIRKHEMELTKAFMDALKDVEDVRIVGPASVENRAPVVSLDFKNHDNAEIAFTLENEYGIATRTGLHCAPNAHKTLNTYPQGTVRFSFGFKNTVEEVLYAAEAVRKVLSSSERLENGL